jgi:hypothetical protein
MQKHGKLVVLAFGLIVALIYNWLFPSFRGGLNFLLFVFILTIAAIILQLIVNKKLFNAWSLLFVVPILWFAVCVFIYNNDFVRSVAPIASLILLFLFYFWSGEGESAVNKIKNWWPIAALAGFFGDILSSVFSAISGSVKVNSQKAGKIFLAIIILVPLVLVFIGLFANADLIFRQGLKDFFDFDVDGHAVWSVFRTIVLFFLFSGLFYAYLHKKRLSEEEKNDEAKFVEREGDNLIAEIIVGVLNALFLVFIVIQLMFLFGGHEIVTKYNITYADYVHNGFYQMVWIAVLVFVISYIMYRVDKKKKINFLKSATALLIVQTLVICASALKRILLYTDAYGLTQMRFLVGNFIVYVALILATLTLVILLRKHYRTFINAGFLISLLYLMLMSAINMQGFVAKINIDRYLSGQDDKIDTNYLSKMSTDAYEQFSRLANDKDKVVRENYQLWGMNQARVFLSKVDYKIKYYAGDQTYWSDELIRYYEIEMKNDKLAITVADDYGNKSVVPLRGVGFGKYWKVLTISDFRFWSAELK